MKVITVTGYKGGVSKSTTAIHIATYLSDKGSVVLIDGDTNRTSLSWSERGSLPFKVVSENNALKASRGKDYLVLDTAARPHSEDLKELSEDCDLMVLPTTPDIVSLDPMLQTIEDLGDKAVYRSLISIVPPHPNKEGQLMRGELQSNGIPIFKTTIRRSTAFQKAALSGVPIRDLTGRDRLPWLDYQNLGKEILEILNNG